MVTILCEIVCFMVWVIWLGHGLVYVAQIHVLIDRSMCDAFWGPFKCYVTQMGWGGGGANVSDFPGKKRYEGVMFNVISVTRGWVGVQFAEK